MFGTVAVVFAVDAIAPAVSGAAAPSPYTASCVNRGNTTLNWKHEKLEQVTIQSVAANSSGTTFAPLVVPVASLI